MVFWIEVTLTEVRSKKCRIDKICNSAVSVIIRQTKKLSFIILSQIIWALNKTSLILYLNPHFVPLVLSGRLTGVFCPSRGWMTKKKKQLSPFEPSTTTWCNHRKRSNSHSRCLSPLPPKVPAFCRCFFKTPTVTEIILTDSIMTNYMWNKYP